MIFILVTCADTAQAEMIAHKVVEDRVAACAQIMSPHHSVYRWQDKVESATEVNLLIKTQSALFDAVKAAVLGIHSYEMPCIVSWRVEEGHAPYLEWLAAQTT